MALVNNPYLEKYTEAMSEGYYKAFISRDKCIPEYGFAIPDEEALNICKDYSPLIELGAGTGYWAMLLGELGADIIAYDKYPPGRTVKKKRNYWFKKSLISIEEGDEHILERHPDRTLLLCWPNYEDNFALNALRLYEGNTLIYIGEGDGGCCANSAFFELLEKDWIEIKRHNIPQWFCIHDDLSVWGRNKND